MCVQVLAFLRTLEHPAAKFIREEQDLVDGRFLRDITKHLFFGAPLGAQEDKTLLVEAQKGFKHTPYMCWVIDTILQEYGVSSFALERWSDHCARLFKLEGLGPTEQRVSKCSA